MDRRSNKSWVGILAGLIFLSTGLAVAYSSAGTMITGYLSSSRWVEVPATIYSVELIAKRGNTTTYSVNSNYSYQFNGENYTSNRVSLSTGSDNIGQYWENLERSLRQAKNSNEAVAFVNPEDPTDSLLDRTLRWKSMVFGSMLFFLFGGVGVFLLWVSTRKTKTRHERLQSEKEGGISSEQKSIAWFL